MFKKIGNGCGGYLPYGYAYSLWTYFRTEGDRDSRSFQPEREPSAVSCHESIWGKI